MEVDDGGRWNITDSTYNGDTYISPDDALIVRNIIIEIDSLIVYCVNRNQVSML